MKSAQSQAKSLEVPSTIHYAVKRFAALSSGVYVSVWRVCEA